MTLTATLERLELVELVKRLAELDADYSFKHALVQDTARSSLLLQERKRLHLLVGVTLEEMYPAQRTELAPLLARHFASGGDDRKTVEYATLAGDAARRINANTEAIMHYRDALAAAMRIDAPVQELFLKRGRAMEVSGDFHGAAENYAEMTRVANARGDRLLELAAMVAVATIYSIPSPAYDEARAQDLNDRSMKFARELDNKEAEAAILWNLMLMHSRVGKGFKIALAYGEQALEIARANNLSERLAFILNDMSPLLTFHGEFERGEQYNLESRTMWVEMDNLPMLGGNYGYAVMNYLVVGDYERAIQASQEGLRLSLEINNSWDEAFVQTWVGQAYLERGEVEKAVEVMRAAVAMGEHVFPPTQVVTRSDLARLYADFGEPERGIALALLALQFGEKRFPSMRPTAIGALGHSYLEAGRIQEAREILRDAPDLEHYQNNPLFATDAVRAQIELALRVGDFAAALTLSDGLLGYLRKNKIRQFEPEILRLCALALNGLGEWDRALDRVERARILAETMNARWSLWQIFAAIFQVQLARGDEVAAIQARAQQEALLEYIVVRTPAELRAGFLRRARAG